MCACILPSVYMSAGPIAIGTEFGTRLRIHLGMDIG